MRISNCRLVYALLQAAGLGQALADAGIDADAERVRAYCERVSASTGRPVRDILDLSIREVITLRVKVESLGAKSPPALPEPGRVIPGCSDSSNSPKRKQGAHLRSPGQS